MNYTLENYNKQSTFSSFLPGISGLYGIPIWCYYVNRGQGVVSFGVQDKDHGIMEFYPAHQAYQNVKRTGFRTFIKVDGSVFEAFADEAEEHTMTISMNQLEIQEKNTTHHLETHVTYFTLPNEKVGALVRKVTLTNTQAKKIEIEVIDGMPACIPYGVGIESMKMMGQTVKAWMQVENLEEKVPYYRVRASMEDAATVTEIEGGNFSFGCLEDGTLMEPIVDPEIIFGYDTTLAYPRAFETSSLEELLLEKQVVQNQLPSSFYATKTTLDSGKSITFYEVIGQVECKDKLEVFLNQEIDGIYFGMKQSEATYLVNQLCEVIGTQTGSEVFDAYTKYTYMDNVLRGGCPIALAKDKMFYIYARKHGDIERDYNYFSVLPEYYSQGNGNFRDVNQNRRLDNFFNPSLGRENIKMFYDFIQLDGYNPLAIEKKTYTIEKDAVEAILNTYGIRDEKVKLLLSTSFTPGRLVMALEDSGLEKEQFKKVFEALIEEAKEQVHARFGEGYWSDHWTYNLDLIESYLMVYPEEEEALLFEEGYRYFLAHVTINKRAKRYVKTEKGIRQYHALDEENKQISDDAYVKTQYGKGTPVVATLIEKLLVLCSVKYATLDAYGMGIEMEGGKPGWYDALNGLPGIFGSSMAETYELKRNLDYVIEVLRSYPRSIKLFKEIDEFIESLHSLTIKHQEALMQQEEVIDFWNEINDAKEMYREKTFSGIAGDYVVRTSEALLECLQGWQKVVERGIEKACARSGGICPTYFAYDVVAYEETQAGIMPQRFEVKDMPYFLEGPVRYLKLKTSQEVKEQLYHHIKASDLYDKKLGMYKVNASLKDASYEIGRAKAFTPGWLENESIWMHMAYKYLLALLKAKLYDRFFEDFHRSAVPFLDPKVYGRSTLENVSFIASSANPNPKYHGKGFVARLSGSTVEFLNMWQVMMFGEQPFGVEDETLVLRFEPVLPSYLIGEDRKITAMFLGQTQVCYSLDQQGDYIPGNYTVETMELQYFGGNKCKVMQSALVGKLARDVRDGKVEKLIVKIKSHKRG